MLISIAGSQGTGKSTVIKALTQLGYNAIERKTSRSILSDWNVTLSQVNNDRDLTVKFQDEILKRKMEDEDIGVSTDKLYLTERTYTDLFVYALVALGKDNEYSDWLDDYYHRCAIAQTTYDKIFYLNAGHFRPVNDGVRAINEHYSNMVDMTMSYYITQMTTQSHLEFVNTPHINERVIEICGSIAHILQGEK